MRRSLPDRFAAQPLSIRETAVKTGEAAFTKRETDEALDRAYGLVIQHAMKVAGMEPKEVAYALAMDESNVRQWFIGKSRPPIGRLRQRFPKFDRAYIDTIVATSEHLEAFTTIRDRRRA